jgi:taurine dioxygenase
VTLAIAPLDAPLGAEVTGYDFDVPLDPSTRDRLLTAIDDHLLLVFRNRDLPREQQVVDFCEAFGPLKPTLADRSRLPGYPGINRVSNRDADGVQGTGGAGIVTFHSDLSFSPPLIEFIYLDAVHVTDEGGDTKWTNLVAAYDALDDTMKARVEGLGVRYRLRDGLDFDEYFKASDALNLADNTEISLVQVNPRTGRKGLWPNTGPDFAAEVDGLSPDDGAALLAELFAHCTEDRFVYRHEWRAGDACLWINTQTMHEREAFPDDQERVLRHVSILGVTDPFQLQAGERARAREVDA